MTAIGATRLVAGRELRETLRRKSFWAVILVLIVATTAAVVVPSLLDDETSHRLLVVGERDEQLVATLTDAVASLDAGAVVDEVPDAATARRDVLEGDADLAVVRGDRTRLIVQADEHPELVGVVGQAMAAVSLTQDLADSGVDPAAIERALARPAPAVDEVARSSAERKAASFILSLVLYGLLLTLMVQAASGTAIEKSSRISEVLLAVVRPGPLLFGKVVGIATTGLITFAAGALPVVVAFVVGGDLPAGLGGALAGGALWFVLGLVLYLVIAGSLGALAERPEEAGVVVAPLTSLLIGTFIVTQSALDSPIGTALAYVPLSSPLVMPARIAEGLAGWPEIVGSLLLLLVAVAVTARFGATVYRRAIVRTGRRLKVRDVVGRSAA